MKPAWPHVWLNRLAIALLGAIALGASPRPALAVGCHAPDRPVLGLSFSWDEPISPAPDRPGSDADADADAPKVASLPCSGETPGALTAAEAAPAADLPAPVGFPAGVSARGPRRGQTQVRTRLLPTTIERPPRLLSAPA